MNNSDHVNLHSHTEFSLLDGAAKITELAAKAKERGFRQLAITDHGSMDGIVRFNKACESSGIKPIFGCEIYLLEHWDKKGDPKFKQKNLHLTVQAKNEKGLKALLKGLGYANTEGWAKSGRSGRPFIPLDYPLKSKDWHGNVIVQTGCASSPFWNAEDGISLLEQYHETFGEDLYAEVMPLHDLDHQYKINRFALEASKAMGLKPIATNDLHFICEDDHEVHDVVLGIGQYGMTWNNPRRWKFDSKLNFLRDASDVYKSLRKMGIDKKKARACILNTQEIGEKCSLKLAKMPVELPQILPDGVNEEKYLIDTCLKQLQKRGLDKPEYLARLERELKAIIKGGFVRYMLMVHDLVQWAKGNDIEVGPGRGSASGSIVSYLLNITTIDPLKYNLVFERFIAEGRNDLPDIDMDFEDRKRHLIEKYLKEKYGEWNVAHVSTFNTMKGKGAVRDVSRLFEVPLREVNEMTKCILERSDADERASCSIMDTVKIFGEAKAFNKKYPNVIKYASKLEGQIRSCGVHAGGFVVSQHDLRSSGNCHLVRRREAIAVNWDKDDLQQMGLMKLDALGISTLAVLNEAKHLIRSRHGVSIDFNTMELDDKKTFEEIRKGNTYCSFQLGTKGLKQFCKDLDASDFKTICDASALWRPGCLRAGITDEYKDCKLGKKTPFYANKIYKQITKDTYGQIVYQEQIMYLLHRMAGMSWSQTDEVRKVISKSEGGEKLMKYKSEFAKGCSKLGSMEYTEAEELFDKLRHFGAYAFNLSHSVAYAMMSYYTMYLKVHYPLEFFSAHLNYGSMDRKDPSSGELARDITIREMKRMGIGIVTPDINRSGIYWTISEDRKLRAGISEIKLCGPVAQEAVIIGKEKVGGEFKSFRHFLDNVNRRRVNKRLVKMLIDSGSMDSILSDEEKKLWRMHYEELYELLGTKNKFTERYEELKKTMEMDWEAKSDDAKVAQEEAINFKINTDVYGQYRKLCNLIKEIIPVSSIKDIEKSRDLMVEKYYVAQATHIKFKYSDKAIDKSRKSKGSANAVGNVYGNLDDGSGYVMGLFEDVYKRRKDDIETMVGEVAVFKGMKTSMKRSGLKITDFTLLRDLEKGENGNLEIQMVEGLNKKGFDLNEYKRSVRSCTLCPLHKGCKAPVPPSIGNLNIMILGEAPGYHEDQEGVGYIGDSGKILFEELANVGILRKDCIVSNVVNCRPKENKLPNLSYVTKCPHTTELFRRFRPRFVLATGNSPLYYFRRLEGGILKWTGQTEWNNKLECFVTYSVHPAFALRDKKENLPILQNAIQEFGKIVSTYS